MANLNATVNDIELKTNRLDSEADLTQMATWDDEKYPTTALLRNVANDLNSRIVTSGSGGAAAVYPVGSVIMTATNSNPGQVGFGGPLPGSWVLVDKAFKHEQVILTTNNWTAGLATLSEGKMIRDGHTISLHLKLRLSQEISGSNVSLGNIKRDVCGITTNSGQFYLPTELGIAYANNASAGASFVVCYTFNGGGYFTIQEVLSSKNNNSGLTMQSGTIITINTSATAHYGDMLSDACDRFYWKRTA